MLEFCRPTQVVSLFLLLSVMSSTAVREGNGSVVPRDTDKMSALRSQIKKLNDLLSTLGEKGGDEYDLLKVSEQKDKNETPAKLAMASEDMRSTTLATNLSKALAKLKQPNFNIDDSTGDYMRTDNNDLGSDDKTTRDMEDMITSALTRLSHDKSEDTQHKSAHTMRSVESQLLKVLFSAKNLGISVGDIIQDLDEKVSEEEKLYKMEEELNDLSKKK